MVKGYEGKLVRLVPLDRERHFENCYRWINDPEVCENLLLDPPTTRAQEEAWFASACAGDRQTVFAIETLEGVHVGTSGIHNIDFRNGRANTGSYIAEPRERGKGYGTDAARVRAMYCFDILGLRLLTSSYMDHNAGSKRMQEKSGYVEHGRLPSGCWKRGRYVDEVLTHLTRERYLELRGQW
ncbi:MAG: GNAT family N-acetyltransferase [Fimbriimonadaceae bacterium]|nr:GNAT family N-acetyltransferase [Fimbriimonadaceae bacterium]